MRKKFVLKFVLFAAIGASLGYGYYYFVGCRTGSCPITSNPLISTAYGALFGMLLGWDIRMFPRLFARWIQKKEEEKSD